MPLKLTRFDDTAVINRWADGIEQDINSLKIPTPLVSNQPTFKTNNVINQAQSTLNLIAGPGINITPGLAGNTVISATASGDGLSHGTTPWESDPSYIILRDDFVPSFSSTDNGSNTFSQIGELGWFLTGSVSNTAALLGGRFPYVGQYAWQNSATGNEAGYLGFTAAGGSGSYTPNCWALGDDSGWYMTWVFKVDHALSNSNPLVLTGKALYVGLSGGTYPFGVNAQSRPDVFIGLRYDTTTGLGDTTFVWEAVANQTYTSAARNNTQGTTQVTTVAPVAGTWHRVDIFSTSNGSVTMMLDGANSFTTPFPTLTVTGGSGSQGFIDSGQGTISIANGSGTPNGFAAYAPGSTITVTGFGGGGTVLNSTWQIYFNASGQLLFDTTGNLIVTSGTPVVTGFPGVTPICVWGNDGTVGSPTGNSGAFYVDFFSFVWNPALGGSAPGVSASTNPRYFTF
jgi:hypothetical protein